MAPLGKNFLASSPVALLLAVLGIGKSSAQLVGVDICACQPSVYRFKLDFSLVCTDNSVGGAGITETSCIVETRDMNQNPSNPVPISVSEVQVLELGQELQVVGNSQFEGQFFDGHEFSYTSMTISNPSGVTPNTIPRGFQVFITGVNSDEEPLVNQWAITYSNDCGLFPLLEVGQVIGWIEFTDLGKPAQEFCPIAGPDTQAPVDPPTEPTEAPVVANTTEAPVVANTTEAPVLAPVVAPVASPEATPPTDPEPTEGPNSPAAPVGPPTCPPYAAYSNGSSKGSTDASSKDGGISKTGKGKSSKAGNGKASQGASSDAGKGKAAKGGKAGVPKGGHTESMESLDSASSKSGKGKAGKGGRWLATGGGGGSECPEPPSSYVSSKASGDGASSRNGGKAGKGTGSSSAMSKSGADDMLSSKGSGGKAGKGSGSSEGKAGKGGMGGTESDLRARRLRHGDEDN